MTRGAAVSTKTSDTGSRNGCVAIDTAFYTEGLPARIFKLQSEEDKRARTDAGGLFDYRAACAAATFSLRRQRRPYRRIFSGIVRRDLPYRRASACR